MESVETGVGNVLSVDVEEWFHICGVAGISGRNFEPRAYRNLARLLSILDDCRVEATFFVLGVLADDNPAIVREIAAAGHEVASHGYSHTLVGELGPQAFREELRRTADVIESQSGCRPRGFRAPQWSLSRKVTPWAFDILVEEGYCYDSSCSPLPFIGDRTGPRWPFRMTTGAGSLWEIPPMVTPSLLGNLPTGGGWGLRSFPPGMVQRTINRLNAAGKPAVLYLHPRELDPGGPRLRLSPLKAFAAYGPRTDVMARLVPLLRQFRFTSLCRLVDHWESA